MRRFGATEWFAHIPPRQPGEAGRDERTGHDGLNQLQAIPEVIATRTSLVFEDVENVGAAAPQGR